MIVKIDNRSLIVKGDNMRTVEALLAEAVRKCGGYASLAAKIGDNTSNVHNMATGKRSISPATVGLLCDVLELDGEEARRLAAEAVIANAKGEKAGVLRRAFFGWPRLGVALALGLLPPPLLTMSDEVEAMEDEQPTETVQLAAAPELSSLTIYRLWRWLASRLAGALTPLCTCGLHALKAV